MENKICVVLRKDHIKNPIQASIKIYCDEQKIPIFDLGEVHKAKDFDLTIIYHNKPISVLSKVVVWWMCDLRPAYIFSGEQKFDAIYLCNKEHIDDYKKRFKADVFYLPQCGDDRETPNEGRVFNADMVFVGNFLSTYHTGRLDIILKIEKSGLKVQSISNEGYSKDTKYIYKNMPFCLAISPNARGYTSNRLYNILSSGGFCITKYFDGIEDIFENKKHLVWFKDAGEVPNIVEYYYNHPDEYDKIKENGKNEYKKRHTAKHRIEEILKTQGLLQEE